MRCCLIVLSVARGCQAVSDAVIGCQIIRVGTPKNCIFSRKFHLYQKNTDEVREGGRTGGRCGKFQSVSQPISTGMLLHLKSFCPEVAFQLVDHCPDRFIRECPKHKVA